MAETLLSWAKEEKNKKFVVLIMLLILAIIFLTFYPFRQGDNSVATTIVKSEGTLSSSNNSYEENLEKKLISILSKMEGVGSVDVMITIASTKEKVVAEDINASEQTVDEKDQSGGTRMTTQVQENTKVVLQSGNVPYVTKENAPEIKGVIIVAEGADNSEVKAQIMDAVSKVLDVPVHKIFVEKKKN